MFRAVDSICAVDFTTLNLPISKIEALNILSNLGINIIERDILVTAREQIGKSIYKRGAKPSQAPDVLDCSSFTKWIYGKMGIWLPRRTIQQIDCGTAISANKMKVGDLIFIKGRRNWFRNNPQINVGHVGIATGHDTIIHAASTTLGVVESSPDNFLDPAIFRTIKRIIPNPTETHIFQTPPELEIETSDDFFWIIVRNL